ncbi:hypothetical protein GXW71_29425 [Roseomonas hellenica]|uniref:Chromosome partition protein Smc n=1 Tax=Plastoroseomonas hellenica TaxID=2687306 RepID=A0ABS5F7G8_9PROT|nr:SbcC/MukB-like Walker B domain-containing protein [Plastoroseomonas hellenica]MBR0668510.1 hypothetical protein [Plastoroseomonas hellenica]
MYWLERLSLHNWYLFEGLDIEVRGATALIGQTGAGKSALIDAIQTVMSGNNRNVIHLNSAAGEARDRRVHGYCLGCVIDVDEGRPRRRKPETTLALTLHDPAAMHRVTIGVLLSADADEGTSEETRQRFVIRGHGFSIDEFLERDVGGQEFMPTHDQLLARMKARFGKALTFHSNSQGFVSEYLTAMRPRVPPNPRSFLRAFSNALAAREIRDPTDFVRRFVLEASPLKVERVRESIMTWRELQKEVERLESMLAAAKGVRARFANWARHKIGGDTQDFLAAYAERLLLEREITSDTSVQAAFEEKRARHQAEAEGFEDSIQRQVDLNQRDAALARASDDTVRHEALEGELRGERGRLQALSATLTNAVHRYARAVQLARLREYLPGYARSAVETAVTLAAQTAKGGAVDWAVEGAELRVLAGRVRDVVRAEQSLVAQLSAAASDLSDLRKEATSLEVQLAAAEQGGPLLSQQTLEFRAELMRRGLQPILLPDLVEVSEPEWAFALEALLGAYREALIVPQDQLNEAFDILFRNRQRFDSCRLVNTRKTRGVPARSLPAGSIAEVASVDDPDARAFIHFHAGRYIRAENPFDLERLDSGVMKNGRTSSGMALRVHRDRPPILGRTAQMAALERARARWTEIHDAIAALEERHRLLSGGLQLLAQIADASEPEALEQDARELEDARLRVLQLQRDITELSRSDPTGILAGIHERQRFIEEMKTEMIEARRLAQEAYGQITKIGERIQQKQQRSAELTQIEASLAAAQQSEQAQRLILVADVRETIIAVRERTENQLGIEWQGRELEGLKALQRVAQESLRREKELLPRALREAGHGWEDFLLKWIGQNPLPAEAEDADKLYWIDARVRRIEDNELLPHRKRVEEARDEMERMLKEDLLAKLAERFETVRVQIDMLNRRLSGHTFVGQRYSFYRRQNDRLKPLYDLARQVAANPQIDFLSLQSNAVTAEGRKAFEQIELIVGDQEDTRQIEDYRNYFEFELQIQSGADEPRDFSKILGLLSGGQRQAPYYVAIAASMTSVYFPGGKIDDNSGMGLVAFDEAFNKLDVKNTQALLDLFRSLGLQVVVAAPEASRPTFLESVDTVITIARNPNTDVVYVDSEHIGPRARQEMRAQNPEHRGVEGFRTVVQPPRTAETDVGRSAAAE